MLTTILVGLVVAQGTVIIALTMLLNLYTKQLNSNTKQLNSSTKQLNWSHNKLTYLNDALDAYEEAIEFEKEVFEMLFGADARPPYLDEYNTNLPRRVFSYEDARDGLKKINKDMWLLQLILSYYRCPEDEEDDTEEAFEFRERFNL